MLPEHDPVDNPSHYTHLPSGVECIDVAEHFNYNRGNAIKYLWRAGRKGDAIEDLRKAKWYVERELKRLGDAEESGEEQDFLCFCGREPKRHLHHNDGSITYWDNDQSYCESGDPARA